MTHVQDLSAETRNEWFKWGIMGASALKSNRSKLENMKNEANNTQIYLTFNRESWEVARCNNEDVKMNSEHVADHWDSSPDLNRLLLISFLCQQISCILTLVQFKDPNATLKISSFLFLWIHSVSQDFLLFVQHRKHTLAWRPDRLHSICNILGCLHHITAIHRSSSLLLVHGNFHVPDQIFLRFFYDWSLQLLLLP